jgi:hypothetical protein
VFCAEHRVQRRGGVLAAALSHSAPIGEWFMQGSLRGRDPWKIDFKVRDCWRVLVFIVLVLFFKGTALVLSINVGKNIKQLSRFVPCVSALPNL